MSPRGARAVAAALAAAALFAGAGARAEQGSQAATGEFEKVRTDSIWVVGLEGDSLWADSVTADSIRKVVIADSLSKIPSVRVDQVAAGFHPSYEVQSSFIRATTNITHVFSLDYQLAENLVSKTRTTWEKRRADRADRETGVRRTEAELQYLLLEGLRVGLKYGRDDNLEKDDLRSTDIALNRLVLQSTFIRDLRKSLRLTASLEGGIETRDKNEDQRATEGSAAIQKWEEKRGRAATSTVGLQYNPGQAVDIQVQGTAARNQFSIETGGDQAGDALNDDNRDATDNWTARARYDEFEFAKAEINATAERSTRTFARPAGGIETATDRRRNATLSLKGAPGSRSEYEARIDYAWGSRSFAIDKAQSSEKLDYGAEVSVGYALPAKLKSKLILKRDFTEDTYFPRAGEPDATGTADRGSVVVNLSRDLWAYTKVRATGSMGLTARVFVDSTQDRDNTDRRVSASLEHAPPGKLSGSADFSVDEGRTVNINSTRSANNETRQTWRLSPNVKYAPRPTLNFTSAYTMTLMYIFKDADSRRNTMTRISELRSAVNWDITTAAKFGLEYRYKLDESGRFRGEGSIRQFDRSQEGETQNLNLRISYRLGKDFSLESGQSLQTEKQFDLSDGKDLKSQRRKTQIYTQAMYKREITEKTSFTLKARQIQDATVPVFPVRTAGSSGEDRRIEWELNGSLTFRL